MHLFTNKKLVISIAINLILVFALSILLYLVYPRLIYEQDSVSNRGRYSVRTYRKHEGNQAYFEILRGHRRIYSYTGKQAFSVEIFGADITGNGAANLVIRQWQGSAHGDSRYLILELDGSVVKEIDVIDGLLDVQIKDLNNDGIAEITGIDKAYSYFPGDCFAGSPQPFVVLSFDETQAGFVPDRRLMLKSPLSQEQLNELGLKYKQDTMWSQESRPPSELFDTMLKLIYSGNKKQAWELFDASRPDTSTISKEQYKQEVENELCHSPFYPVIAGWNKEKS